MTMMKGNESATNIEAINNEYSDKLQKQIKKFKKKLKKKIKKKVMQMQRAMQVPTTDKPVQNDPSKPKGDKEAIANLRPDEIHPVPGNIPPGSYTYYLFKARFHNDISANTRVNNMPYIVSAEEQVNASRLLAMYEAGYKAGQRIMSRNK